MTLGEAKAVMATGGKVARAGWPRTVYICMPHWREPSQLCRIVYHRHGAKNLQTWNGSLSDHEATDWVAR